MEVSVDFRKFKPWSGAKETWERIEQEGKIDDFERLLDECYPEQESINETQLNDILWFDKEWVLENLGIEQPEEEDCEEMEEIRNAYMDDLAAYEEEEVPFIDFEDRCR